MSEGHDERRIVTALFADVAGSTALSERLDPEEAKLVIGEAVSRAIQAVEAYGGSINNLLGDGLLALFGAPLAHEDDPERAVRAGLDIISAMTDYAEEVRRSWGVAGFAMRVAIHTGEVVVGQVGAGGRVEYGVVGDTINTTARLQAAAESNGVLVSEQTQRQVRDRFNWGEPQSLKLKGKADAITAFPVLELVEAARASQPASSPPMVGRDSELSSGLEMLQRLPAGRGGILYIVGEPGIGKSRLAAELRGQAGELSDLTWMEGRCVSYGESLPYWPYRDLLRNWLEVSPTDPELRVRVKLRRKVEAAFGDRGSEAYPYIATVMGLTLEPDAAAQLRPLAPESVQYRTFEVMGELLQRIASTGPLVIALDDLHWADPTSLALTDRLFALTESEPVLLTISQRPETDHPSWLLKEKAAREYRHLFRELGLQPLGHDSETRLLDSLSGGRKLPAPVTDRLLAYAEGNPFYLEQILRSLVDGGTLIPENGHWTLKGTESLVIPQTLEGVIVARIDRLEPQWREVLTSASILGRNFSLGLLTAVTGLAPAELRQAVHHLLRLDLLREDGIGTKSVYRYKHALIQDAAYHTLVASRRATLHRRAAEWYESYYADRLERVYGLIAHHWLGTDDHVKAAHFLKLAGDRAAAEWSLDEAVVHYRALIPLLKEAGKQQEAADTLFQLATALHLAMRYREANETWQQAFGEWRAPAPNPTPPAALLKLSSPLIPWDPDPTHAIHTSNLMLHQSLYRTLLKGRPGPYVVPELAVRWEVSDDGRHYLFHLDREGRWNDGSPFTAGDVVEGFRAILDPKGDSTESAHLSSLENADAFAAGEITDFGLVGVQAPDDLTLEFKLHTAAPYWIFPLVLVSQSGALLGRTNGPWRLIQLDASGVVIERDPRHPPRGPGNISRVEWVQEAREHALNTLLRGDVDGTHLVLPTPAMNEAVSQGKLTADVGAALLTTYVCFTAVPPFAPDLPLRRAMAHAIDRHALGARLASNQEPAQGALVPPGLFGHTPNSVLPFDPELARQYRQKSEHQGTFRLTVPRGAPLPSLATVLEGWRKVLELDIEVIEIDFKDLDKQRTMAHAGVGLWVAGYPDPEYFLRQLLHSRSPRNVGAFSSSAFDDLVDRATAQETSATRLALFHEADRMAVQQDCSVIPLLYTRPTILLQPWVHGWWSWGAPWFSFDDLTVDERSPRFNRLNAKEEGNA